MNLFALSPEYESPLKKTESLRYFWDRAPAQKLNHYRHPMRIAPLVSLLALRAVTGLSAADYYVSPRGQDTAAGTAHAPFQSLTRALAEVQQYQDAPGSTVWLCDGLHTLNEPIALGAEFSGKDTAPFTIRAVHAGQATVSGGILINPAGFKPLPPQPQASPATASHKPQAADFIQKEARAHIVAIRLSGSPASTALDKPDPLVSSAGWTLPLARWPDKGYAHAQKIIEEGAVWTNGRTLGPRPVSSRENPIGGEFTLRESWRGDWAGELAAGVSKPEVRGYFYFDWWFERNPIASVQAGKLKLQSDSRYGFGGKEKLPRRIYVSGLISELDRPGEWFWDTINKDLYIWPVADNAPVSIAGRFDLFSIKNANHVIIRDLVLEMGQNGVVVTGGNQVTVAGCTVRNLSGVGIQINNGLNHQIQSCDLYSLDTPIRIQGTPAAKYKWDNTTRPPRLVSDGHVVTNNHIRNASGGRGISISGVGVVFSHNLIHDLPGSALSWSGNDHVIEYNEMYSLMKELGDWGVTYSGATWYSFGNVLRFNFVHHILSLPQAHPANGFYFDDLKAGDTTHGNVFYKAGNRSVMCNGGGAQTITNNLFVNNYINVYQNGTYAEKYRAERPKFDSGELKRGDKTDLWWKTEQVVGPAGWAHPPWSEAYPEFKRLMEGDPFNAGLTRIARNYEMGTIKDTIWLKEVPQKSVEAEPMHPITDAAFINPEVLNFAFRADFKLVEGFERIPFEQIGLVKDEYRTVLPDKDQYRRQVRERNLDQPPYDPKARYDGKIMNELLYPSPPYWVKTSTAADGK